jgi:succinate dehydrogenase / fumarate reductase, membrane anchor subunit
MDKSPASASDITALRDDTVLRRVRHLGSAHSGLGEWRIQRLSALALIPLGLCAVVSLVLHVRSGRTAAAAWLGSPLVALLVLLLIAAATAHTVVGLRSVLRDYVHTRWLLVASDLLVRAAAALLLGASLLAVLTLFLAR